MSAREGSGPSASPFDAAGDSYDRARPGYPAELFDDLFAYAAPSRAPSVLEIGAGTGQATRALLQHAGTVTAVELGARLATKLRENLAKDPRLVVLQDAFEETPLQEGGFAVAVVATAFHWLDPEVRLAKIHSVLGAGGTVGIIDTVQIASEADAGFFDACRPVYQRYRPDEEARPLPAEGQTVSPALSELQSSPLFRDERTWRYRWDQRYSRSGYAHLVRSYSDTQAMAPDDRESLIADLEALIDAAFGGVVVRPLEILLTAARKQDSAG